MIESLLRAVAEHRKRLERLERLEVGGTATGKVTTEGGFAIRVVAGENLSRGEVVYVKIAGGADGKVWKTGFSYSESIQMPVGFVYADASADADVWVVVSGIAYALPEAGVTATRGNVVIVSNATAKRSGPP